MIAVAPKLTPAGVLAAIPASGISRGENTASPPFSAMLAQAEPTLDDAAARTVSTELRPAKPVPDDVQKIEIEVGIKTVANQGFDAFQASLDNRPDPHHRDISSGPYSGTTGFDSARTSAGTAWRSSGNAGCRQPMVDSERHPDGWPARREHPRRLEDHRGFKGNDCIVFQISRFQDKHFANPRGGLSIQPLDRPRNPGQSGSNCGCGDTIFPRSPFEGRNQRLRRGRSLIESRFDCVAACFVDRAADCISDHGSSRGAREWHSLDPGRAGCNRRVNRVAVAI